MQISVWRFILPPALPPPPPVLVPGPCLCPPSSDVRLGGEERESTFTLASTPLKLAAASVGGGLDELILPLLRTGCSWSAGSKILRLFWNDKQRMLVCGCRVNSESGNFCYQHNFITKQ